MKLEAVKTDDGSFTLRWIDQDECYHSRHGAIQESMHVYIQAGLQHLMNNHRSKVIRIFEVGFGTGLNALLTYQSFTQQHRFSIDYHAVETFPLPEVIWKKLSYPAVLGEDHFADVFSILHGKDFNSTVSIGDRFTLTKQDVSLQEYQPTASFDLIYYDAFGPRVQPELWSDELLAKVGAMLSDDGVLVTYCAKGAVKRALRSCGLQVASLPGPPGKREIIRASKC